MDLYDSLKDMHNGKSQRNDGLTKEFYETFWSHIKENYINSNREAKLQNQFSISQRQAIIKLIEKKDIDKRLEAYISLKCRPQNTLKSSLGKIKKIFLGLISSQQTAYVKNRHINESEKIIPNIIETARLNNAGFLVAMDIEKAFNSLDHRFLISVMKKYGLR